MAKPFREGKGWSVRLRLRGQDVYLSGHATAAAAEAAARRQQQAIEQLGKPARLGPRRTPLGVALQDYARERLPFLKGARQEANRINKYLRVSGLDIVSISPAASSSGNELESQSGTAYWLVACDPSPSERVIPGGLGGHRTSLSQRTSKSDRLRQRIATSQVADVTPHQLQQFFDALAADGLQPATISLERALLRRLFFYAAEVWAWAEPAFNPACGVRLPHIDNGRERVLRADEQERLLLALAECKNPAMMPAVIILLETAMRVSEALSATWSDFNRSERLLSLRDAKAGKRDVPLSPLALATLDALPTRAAEQHLFCDLSYEGFKAAWNRACERASIQDLHIHDLRHTAATRFALAHGGNIFLLKALTGHKTLSQLQRYVNVTATDVVNAMHAQVKPEANRQAAISDPPAPTTNIVHIDFSQRRRA